MYAFSNMTGHLLKILSYYFLYKAVVEISITQPFALLFRDVEQQRKQLEQQSQELAHQNLLLNAVFETEPGGLAVIAGPELTFRLANDTYRSITSRPQEDPIGRPFRDFWPAKVAEQGEAFLRKVLDTGQTLELERFELPGTGGKPRYFTFHVRPMDWEGQPAALVTVWETTAQEEAREKMEAANRELEAFTSVASHDLQEPLRKIRAFGDRLNQRYGNSLGEDGGLYLEKMTDSARRMQVLIDDLLALSRLSRRPRQLEQVNLEQVLGEVLADLEARIEQTHGEVLHGPLPEIRADRLRMRQLLQNLVGNALTFHQADTPPVVQVSSICNNGTVQLEVRDNGIGFDQQYAEQIFEPFHRLHGRSEYEGTGMGLAICKKIVEQHGGTIRAESRPNEGTIFTITLPIQ